MLNGGTTPEAKDSDAQSLFEVTDLPQESANLLLVVERHSEGSPIMSFQNYAFPKSVQNNAQVLLFIWTY